MDNPRHTPDPLISKFTKSLQRFVVSREGRSACGSDHKSVKFNAEVIETSFGGTQTPTRIRDTSVFSDISNSSNLLESPTNNQTTQLLPQKFTPSEKCSKQNQYKTNQEPPTKKEVPSINKQLFINKTDCAKKTNMFHTPEAKKRSEISHRVTNDPAPLTRIMVSDNINLRTPVDSGRRHTLDSVHLDSSIETPECFNAVAFPTPGMTPIRTRLSVDIPGMESKGDNTTVTVAVRVRPFSQREIGEEAKCVVSMDGSETIVTGNKGDEYSFSYDHSFWSFSPNVGEFAGQSHVYNALARPILEKAFEGYNTCLFAYGQTGSGKSYSIMGHGNEVGIVPRFCEELFDHAETVNEAASINVEISYFEIYNEKIHDLLGPSSKDKSGRKHNLKVREHPALGPYVEGLSSYVVKSFNDIKGWLSVGNKHRATAATGMNDKSSRSHSVFTIVLTQTRHEDVEGELHDHNITSKINLVDLAGSERQSLAKTSGDRLREGASINKSLLTLGKVISLLAESSIGVQRRRKPFIPYRDSVLTWLLKESLGGNSKTAMLATISPASVHMEETLSTLRYAKQARAIVNSARVNEDPKARLIRDLRLEIDKLRHQTGGGVSDDVGASMAEIANLRESLRLREREMAEMTESWKERLKRSEQHKLEEAQQLEKSGIVFKLEGGLPNLVNLNEDPQLSEMLLYVLRPGCTRVGRQRDLAQHEIQLCGALIADNHCEFNSVGKTVTITPIEDALVYINGDLITTTTTLKHGDRVVLGGAHYFRFNHPLDSQRKVSDVCKSMPLQIKDFEFARQELIRVQNEKLEAELEEVRRQHEAELRAELERQKDAARQRMEEERQRIRQQADQQMMQQRGQYEQRLTELEAELMAQRQKEQHADFAFQKLEDEKSRLLRELQSNHHMDTTDSSLPLSPDVRPPQSSALLEYLEREKHVLQTQLEEFHKKRAEEKNQPTYVKPKGSTWEAPTKKELYRIHLRMWEANKISKNLKKETMFMYYEVTIDGEQRSVVRVTNKKLGIRTYWSFEKFDSRLLQMRDLDADSEHCVEADQLFLNPNDTWEKDRTFAKDAGISPKMLKILKRESPGRVKKQETPHTSPPSYYGSMLEVQNSSVGDSQGSLLRLCGEQMGIALEQHTGEALQETIADKLLKCCQRLRTVVTSLTCLGGDTRMSSEGETSATSMSAMQLTADVQTLLMLAALWVPSMQALRSSHIDQLSYDLSGSVEKLVGHVRLLLQGLEIDTDSMVQEAGDQIVQDLYLICQHCGELCLATDTSTQVLQWQDADLPIDTDPDDQQTQAKVSLDLQQKLVEGCDMFVDRTVQGALTSVGDCGITVTGLADTLHHDQDGVQDILQQVEVTVASSKVLLQKLQEVQSMDLEMSVRESLGARHRGPLQQYFTNSQCLITHIGSLVDAVSLLTQVTESHVKGESDSGYRRLCHCADLIQKSSTKILSSFCKLSNSLCDSGRSPSDLSDMSVSSDHLTEELQIAGGDVKMAAAALGSFAVKHIAGPLNGKAKRILPISPTKSTNGFSSPMHSSRERKIKCKLDLSDYT